MKHVLITGVHGYIGDMLAKYLVELESFDVDGISVQGEDWISTDFSKYDSIVHLAGIAHRKETSENIHLYYDINRDLTIQVAEKAKREHVKQFIFISTMSVYGLNSGIVTKDTIPSPKSHYGKSKLQAEEALHCIGDEKFKVCIIRPPMVYGYGCKGNFQLLIKLIKSLPVFPRVNNRRSMIYIDNLCEFIKRCILDGKEGVFCPQNREYVGTDDIAMLAAQKLGKRVYLSRFLGVAVCCIRRFSRIVEKAFGSFIFQEEDSDFSYCVVEKDDSILQSVEVP